MSQECDIIDHSLNLMACYYDLALGEDHRSTDCIHNIAWTLSNMTQLTPTNANAATSGQEEEEIK